MSGIGFLYADTGLKDLLHGSDVFGAGTVLHMLSGKDYHRAVKGLLLVDKALTKVFFFQFNRQCTMEITQSQSRSLNYYISSARHAKIHKLTLMLVM